MSNILTLEALASFFLTREYQLVGESYMERSRYVRDASFLMAHATWPLISSHADKVNYL
jgi:hypothetical protein